jgi:hypothetical protein
MRGFKPATNVVTLKRPTAVEDEFLELEFVVYAVPAGFRSWLLAQFPPPMKYTQHGKAPGQWVKDEAKYAEWDDRFALLLLAKGLEPGSHLDHVIDWSLKRSASGWMGEAEAVLAEMRAANLTQAEVMTLCLGVMRAGTESAGERGKSSARSGEG